MINSRIPVVTSPDTLLNYKWATRLPRPVRIDLTASSQSHPTTILIGETSKTHIFANKCVVGGVTYPAITQHVWGFGADNHTITSPGPTLVATENKTTYVRWRNVLPHDADWPFVHVPHELLPTGSPMRRYSIGHSVIHLHGAHLEWTSDGYPVRIPRGPRNPSGDSTILSPKKSRVNPYPNKQFGGTTLWYHDHAMDMTSRNVYAGLAGFYLLRHKDEATVTLLPKGQYEVELAIQDRSFAEPQRPNRNKKLLYANATTLLSRADGLATAVNCKAGRDKTREVMAELSPEFKGLGICVNGALWPTLDVEPRAYRFRLLNGSNSRIYVMRISSGDDQASIDAMLGALPMFQIGGDGGFLPNSVALTGDMLAPATPNLNFLTMAPGERVDVIVDFSGKTLGDKLYLTNHATDTSPWGNGGDEQGATEIGTRLIMQFNVIAPTAAFVQPPINTTTIDMALLPLQPTAKASSLAVLPTATRAYYIHEFSDIQLTQYTASLPPASTLPPAPLRVPGWNGITFQSDLAKVHDDGSGTNPSGISLPGLIWPSISQNPELLIPEVGPPLGGGPAYELGDYHQLGQLEVWAFINRSNDVHPLHIHLVQFRIYARESVVDFLARVGLTALPPTLSSYTPPAANINVDMNELGWKDSVRANLDEITWILVKFEDYAGHFIWHCHLLEHEDMGMMRPIETFV